MEYERSVQEKNELQRHYVMYYEITYGLNIEMHKQVIPFLCNFTAVDRNCKTIRCYFSSGHTIFISRGLDFFYHFILNLLASITGCGRCRSCETSNTLGIERHNFSKTWFYCITNIIYSSSLMILSILNYRLGAWEDLLIK